MTSYIANIANKIQIEVSNVIFCFQYGLLDFLNKYSMFLLENDFAKQLT